MLPYKESPKNMSGLTNARSLTGLIFTTEEQPQNHCQVGNLKLALDVNLGWVGERCPSMLGTPQSDDLCAMDLRRQRTFP